jgi:hypothetical protein
MFWRQKQKILIFIGLCLVFAGLSLFFERNSDSPKLVKNLNSNTSPGDRVVATSNPASGQPQSVNTLPPQNQVTGAATSAEKSEHKAELFPGGRWQVMPKMTALSPARMSQLGYSKQMAKGQVSGYYLFAGPGFDSQERAFIVDQPMIVRNERTGDLGVVTGSLQVTLNDNNSLEILLTSYNLKVLNAFPHLKTYVVTSQFSPFDLLELSQRLARDSEVVAIEVEVLSRDFKTPRGQR